MVGGDDVVMVVVVVFPSPYTTIEGQFYHEKSSNCQLEKSDRLGFRGKKGEEMYG